MKKLALYSRAPRSRPVSGTSLDAPASAAEFVESDAAPSVPEGARLRAFALRYERPLLFLFGGLVVLVVAVAQIALRPPGRALTQKDIDAAVLHSLENNRPPSVASRAYEAVRRSVVRVRSSSAEVRSDGRPMEGVGIGSGVVIVDTGIILTNLHVVAGAEKILVEFDDGTESEASVVGIRPEHDLAVLQAKQLPDDLPAATLRSTADLVPGDEVVAVGFPFGIGPSASAGIISGLARDYFSPKGKRVLSNLIQFDAAANPGNSGGPLVTADGEVVGIVTGILNPTDQRVFIGIGFAVPIENAAAAAGLSPF